MGFVTSPLSDLTSDRDASDMTPLGALIEEVQSLFADTHGVPLTNGDIARRSKGRLTRQRVQQLAKDPIKAMPSPEVILGLALGLAVPESVVLERALASSGYYKPRGERREEIPYATANRQAVDASAAAPSHHPRNAAIEAELDQIDKSVDDSALADDGAQRPTITE